MLLLLLFIYLTSTEVKNFTIKNIYIAVAIPLNDKEKSQRKKNNCKEKTKYNGQRNKLRIKTLMNNIVRVTLSLSHKR